MNETWDTELETAVAARLRSEVSDADLPLVEIFATLGLETPSRSPAAVVTVGKFVTVKEDYIAGRAHILGDVEVFVNYSMEGSDVMTGSGLRGVRGLRDLAHRGEQALLGHTPQFSDAGNSEGLGAVWCLRWRGQELYQAGEGPTIEIEQEWAIRLQFQKTQS
jgi:hypothetical protein